MTTTQAVGQDREYETIYVLRPDVDRQSAEQISGRVTDVIGKGGGKLTRVESWGRRRLAYEVQKHKRGVYVYLRYVGGGTIVTELERNLRMLDPVLKFQTVKIADGLSVAGVDVKADDVKFEHVEPAEDEGEEESIARALGLEAPPPGADGEGEGESEGEGEEGAADDDGEAEARATPDGGSDATKSADADAKPEEKEGDS